MASTLRPQMVAAAGIPSRKGFDRRCASSLHCLLVPILHDLVRAAGEACCEQYPPEDARPPRPVRNKPTMNLSELKEMKILQLAKLAKDLNIEDRKSTRLNSSHVAISYAVFCL